MRIVFFVAVLMVAPMCGDPSKDWSLDSHRPERRQDDDHWLGCLEAPMSEEAVKANGDPEGGCKIHAGEDGQVHPVEGVGVPQEHDCDYDSSEGNYNSRKIGEFQGERRAVVL